MPVNILQQSHGYMNMCFVAENCLSMLVLKPRTHAGKEILKTSFALNADIVWGDC
jgi:hypothetical protein